MGRSGLTRAQQVGVDPARRRESGIPCVRGRSAGRSPPVRRAAPGTRPGGARRARGSLQRGPHPAFGRDAPRARAQPSGRFPEGSREHGEYCLLGEGLFPVLLARKESLS